MAAGHNLWQDRLAQHEDHETDNEPDLGADELTPHQAAPDCVRDQDDDWVRHGLGVLRCHQPLEGVRNAAIEIHDEVLDVVIHPTLAVLRHARAPDEPLQQHGQEQGRIAAQAVHNVRVVLEEVVHTVVIPLTIRSDSQEVTQHSLGHVEAAALDSPQQWGDALGAHLNLEQPSGTRPTGSALDRTLQLPDGVDVDGLHDDCRTLVDRADQHLCDERQRPPKGLETHFVIAGIAVHLDVRRDQGSNELGGNAVAHMAQAQGRDVVNHFPRIHEELPGHHADPLGNEMEPRVRLSEIVLSGWGNREEFGVDVRTHRVLLALFKPFHERHQCFLPDRRLAQVHLQNSLHVFPQPIPSDLMLGIPILREQLPQGGEHAGLELRQVHSVLRRLGNPHRKQVALLFQTGGVCNARHNGVEACKDLLQPDIISNAHDRSVELKHFLESRGHFVQVCLHSVPICLSIELVSLLTRSRAVRVVAIVEMLDLLRGALLLILLRVGLLPTQRQDLQAVGVVCPEINDRPADVVQQ
mmetsp:Transcript_9984/g.22503  ORF Transcript_9984/g.22503 Transcript_9984/m.22503 type:complete len:525 (-) Transcript_9984:971-2545(-)